MVQSYCTGHHLGLTQTCILDQHNGLIVWLHPIVCLLHVQFCLVPGSAGGMCIYEYNMLWGRKGHMLSMGKWPKWCQEKRVNWWNHVYVRENGLICKGRGGYVLSRGKVICAVKGKSHMCCQGKRFNVLSREKVLCVVKGKGNMCCQGKRSYVLSRETVLCTIKGIVHMCCQGEKSYVLSREKVQCAVKGKGPMCFQGKQSYVLSMEKVLCIGANCLMLSTWFTGDQTVIAWYLY